MFTFSKKGRIPDTILSKNEIYKKMFGQYKAARQIFGHVSSLFLILLTAFSTDIMLSWSKMDFENPIYGKGGLNVQKGNMIAIAIPWIF